MAIALTSAVAASPLADAANVRGAATPAWRFRAIVFAPLIGATVLSKIGIPPLAAAGIELMLPLTLATLVYGFLSDHLRVEPGRLVFLLLTVATLGFLQVMRSEAFPLPSFMMMSCIALTYAFTTRGAVGTQEAVKFFCNLSAAIALLGVVQFLIQFLGNPALTFPIEAVVPHPFLTQGYNNIPPLYYGSPLYRSMGFVMLEPSYFSQLCAIGFMAELATRSRNLRLALYIVGIMVSYSGTGPLILAIALPIFIVTQRRWDLLLRGILLLGVVLVLAEPLNLHLMTQRIGEFASPESSAFARFVGWQEMFADKFWPSATATLFGHGIGSFDIGAGYAAAEMTHAKVLFEMGVLGGLVYFAFIFYCVFSNGAPRALQCAIVVCFFMNGAYSTLFTGLAISLLLWPKSQPSMGGERGLA